MNKWIGGVLAVLLGMGTWSGAAWASSSPEDNQAGMRQELSEDDHGQMKKHRHHMAMKWLKNYPEEHQQWLTLMQERHLIMADLIGKRKDIAALQAAAEQRKDRKALDAADKIREEQMKGHFKALREKREQLRQQCKALKEQHDKLKENQIRAAISQLLETTKEMNEILKAKGKTMDQIKQALQP